MSIRRRALSLSDEKAQLIDRIARRRSADEWTETRREGEPIEDVRVVKERRRTGVNARQRAASSPSSAAGLAKESA